MSHAESSVRLDPRSSFAFSLLSYLQAMEGHYEAAMDASQRAVKLNPYDMGARGVLGICHLVIGEHRQAIELFSMAAQRGNSDPRYRWAALNAFSHYLLGQYDASLSWAREALVFESQSSSGAGGASRGAGAIGRAEEAAKASRSPARQHFPDFTVERHLRNFRWKSRPNSPIIAMASLKAGLPFGNTHAGRNQRETRR